MRMWNLLDSLVNKWACIGLAFVGIVSYTVILKMSYSNLELSLQKVESDLITTSNRLSQTKSKLLQQKAETNRLIKVNSASEEVNRKIVKRLQALQSENSTLKHSISDLKQEDADVKIYLDTAIPTLVLDRLRMEY